jgi:hypothetical protein
MIRFNASTGRALGAAAAVLITLVTRDANATDILDNLLIYGACCGGPAVAAGLIPGLLEYGLWRTDNPNDPTYPAIKRYNLRFRTSSTILSAPDPNGEVELTAGSTRLLTATASGGVKVGVGVTQPSQPLDVLGRIRTRQTRATAGLWMADSNGANLQFVGVKTHSAAGTSQEAGFWLNNAWRVYFKGDGQVFKAGGGSWSAISDARVKQEVSSFEPGLAVLENVRPVKFKYNGLAGTVADGREYVGVIAQELESVAPFMVQSSPTTLQETDLTEANMKTVDPSAFTYMLVNAVRELSRQNRELTAALCEINPKAKPCSPRARPR